MTDTYQVTNVTKTINATGAVAQVQVSLANMTNTFGPQQLALTITGDFTVKPGDQHILTLS